MKAIITGATGGLGRNLVNHLLSKQWDVLALGRNQSIGDQLNTRFKSFDLSDDDAVMKHFEPADIVFHCAALSAPWGAYDDFYQTNIVATENIIKACKKFNIGKLVHISTPSIYFNNQDAIGVKEKFVSDKFANHYAATKYAAEQLVVASDVNATIIRPRGIFGEYDQVLLPKLLKIAEKGFLPLVKDRSPIVDVTYVGNVVHALYLAATIDTPDKAIFNITNDQPLEVAKLYQLIVEHLKLDVKYKYISETKLIMMAYILETLAKLNITAEPLLTRYGVGLIAKSQTLDISNAKNLLGYKPIYTIEQGLTRYVNWKN